MFKSIPKLWFCFLLCILEYSCQKVATHSATNLSSSTSFTSTENFFHCETSDEKLCQKMSNMLQLWQQDHTPFPRDWERFWEGLYPARRSDKMLGQSTTTINLNMPYPAIFADLLVLNPSIKIVYQAHCCLEQQVSCVFNSENTIYLNEKFSKLQTAEQVAVLWHEFFHAVFSNLSHIPCTACYAEKRNLSIQECDLHIFSAYGLEYLWWREQKHYRCAQNLPPDQSNFCLEKHFMTDQFTIDDGLQHEKLLQEHLCRN